MIAANDIANIFPGVPFGQGNGRERKIGRLARHFGEGPGMAAVGISLENFFVALTARFAPNKLRWFKADARLPGSPRGTGLAGCPCRSRRTLRALGTCRSFYGIFATGRQDQNQGEQN